MERCNWVAMASQWRQRAFFELPMLPAPHRPASQNNPLHHYNHQLYELQEYTQLFPFFNDFIKGSWRSSNIKCQLRHRTGHPVIIGRRSSSNSGSSTQWCTGISITLHKDDAAAAEAYTLAPSSGQTSAIAIRELIEWTELDLLLMN